MQPEDRPPSSRGASALAVALAVLVLASPLRAVWTADGVPWWAPFALWAGLVALGAWVARGEG